MSGFTNLRLQQGGVLCNKHSVCTERRYGRGGGERAQERGREIRRGLKLEAPVTRRLLLVEKATLRVSQQQLVCVCAPVHICVCVSAKPHPPKRAPRPPFSSQPMTVSQGRSRKQLRVKRLPFSGLSLVLPRHISRNILICFDAYQKNTFVLNYFHKYQINSSSCCLKIKVMGLRVNSGQFRTFH